MPKKLRLNPKERRLNPFTIKTNDSEYRFLPKAKYSVLGVVVGLFFVANVDLTHGQSQRFRGGGFESRDLENDNVTGFPSNEFIFCRIKYDDVPGGGFYGTPRWSIDYPESDINFSLRITELTTLKVPKDENGEYKHALVRLTDEELFNYPFIYMLEVGSLFFSDSEVESLRKYLLRGGFLMVDDFWGDRELAHFETQIFRVLDPNDYDYRELELDHPIFSCVFEVKEKPQVPAPHHWLNWGRSYEGGPDTMTPHYIGIFDKKNDNRLMGIICHNTDLGDGWEREGMNRAYFEEFSVKKAYPMGINIVVYALTH